MDSKIEVAHFTENLILFRLTVTILHSNVFRSDGLALGSFQSMNGAAGFGGGTLTIYQFNENPDYNVADSLPV